MIGVWWLLWAWAGVDGVVQVTALTQPWDDGLLRLFYATGAAPIVRKDVAITPHDGFGVWLRDDLLVTAGHVVRGASAVRLKDGAQESTAIVLDVDVDADVAWLQPVRGSVVPRPRPISRAEVVQLPGGDWGRVTGVSPRAVTGAPRPFLQTDLVVKPGLSGSPLLDEDGAVAGLVVGGQRVAGSDEGPAIAAPSGALVPRAAPAPVDEAAWSVGSAPDLTWRELSLRFVDGAVEVVTAPERWARLGWRAGMRLSSAAGRPIDPAGARELLLGLRGPVVVVVAGAGPLVAPG